MHEQSPEAWWRALLPLLEAVAAELRTADPAVSRSRFGHLDIRHRHPSRRRSHARPPGADVRRHPGRRTRRSGAGWPRRMRVVRGSHSARPSDCRRCVWFMESHPARDRTDRGLVLIAADYLSAGSRASGASPTRRMRSRPGTTRSPVAGQRSSPTHWGCPASWFPRVHPSGTPVSSLLPQVAERDRVCRPRRW